MKMSRVRLNRRTMKHVLAGGLGMDAMLQAEANRLAAHARAIAPIDTGAYRASIRVEAANRPESGGLNRRLYRVRAGGPGAMHANLVEIQSSVLARTLATTVGSARTNR